MTSASLLFRHEKDREGVPHFIVIDHRILVLTLGIRHREGESGPIFGPVTECRTRRTRTVKKRNHSRTVCPRTNGLRSASHTEYRVVRVGTKNRPPPHWSSKIPGVFVDYIFTTLLRWSLRPWGIGRTRKRLEPTRIFLGKGEVDSPPLNCELSLAF